MKKWVIVISAIILTAHLGRTLQNNYDVNARIQSEKQKIADRIEIFSAGADRIRAKRLAMNNQYANR